MSKASSKARKLLQNKMNFEQTEIDTGMTVEERLKHHSTILDDNDKAAARAVLNKEFAQKEIKFKLKIRPPEDEPPEQTTERAFRNAEIFLANKRIWKIFGFDDVPKDFTTLESRASRFAIFFVALDGTIAQSAPAMKELDNPRYDERVAPFLLVPSEKPAHYLADYIARFQTALLNQNPATDYEYLLHTENTFKLRDLYRRGTPLGEFMEYMEEIRLKLEDFTAKFNHLRNTTLALFWESKDFNQPITEDFINMYLKP